MFGTRLKILREGDDLSQAKFAQEKRFYVPDADKQRKKFDKIISHETHLL